MNQSGSLAQVWRKSSRCDSNQCLEVATSGTATVAVRSTLDPQTQLRFDPVSWQALIRDIRQGRFDR